MSDIQQDVAHNHVGGSNIEFEEKAMNMLATMLGFSGYVSFEDTKLLETWCDEFLKNHPIHSEVTLTQQEIDTWFDALEVFRQHHINLGATDMYVKPIDYTILPVSLLNLWKLSDCEN